MGKVMGINVFWFTDSGRTYEIERSDDNGGSWASIANLQAVSPYTDVDGGTQSLYRVRDDTDPTPSPWSPAFYGQRIYPMAVCTVTGYILNPDLTPKPYSTISIKLPVMAYTSGNFISRSVMDGYDTQSDGDGRWSVDIPQGLWVELKIEDLEIDRRVLIPNAPTVTLEALL